VRLLSWILAGIILGGCGEQDNGVERGVSKELARERKATVGGVSYELYFSIPEKREEAVMAESVITFEYTGSSPLVIDFKATKEQILALTSEGRRVPYAFKNEHLVIHPKHLKEGRNVLHIKFIAGESALNRREEYLYTLLVPDRCRSLMPCFDQPDIKGRFRLMLKVPPTWKAVANGEMIREEIFHDYTLYEFEETKPLSTYLFAFTAGEFNRTYQYIGGRWIGIYYRDLDSATVNASIPAIANEVRYALFWMKRYTGITYPFQTYNVVAIPDFQFGGMEHPGATYFKASTIFLPPDAGEVARMKRSEVIAHETAHMWFGDFVTMKWFDDVWLKEVFAGFMADKIMTDLYPHADHQMNFFMNHHEPALRTDRTRGTHPIVRPLANLKDAGMLYGDIIYHKAPIVMRMLEQEISPYELQRGLCHYLRRWNYSNADWNDLIQLLQSTSGRDLQAWNAVWVMEKGAPVVEFLDEGIVMRDEWGKGRVWPQHIIAMRRGLPNFLSIDLVDTLTPYRDPEIVLPNCSATGYGCFLPNEGEIRFLNDNLSRLQRPLHRGVAWQGLYEGVLYNKLKGESFIRLCMKHLALENNNFAIQQALSFMITVHNTYIDEGARQLLRDELDRFFMTMLFKNRKDIYKKPFFRALLAIYSSRDVGNYFLKVLRGQYRREDLVLQDEDRMTVAYHLVLRDSGLYDQMKHYITRTIQNKDLLDRFRYVYPAVSGDKQVRDSVFNALMLAENRANEVWATDALRWLNHPRRKAEAEEYIPKLLAKLQEIQETGDIFFPVNWLEAGLSGHTSKYAYTVTRHFLDKNPNYPENLRLKILAATDHLRRLHE
jgi:aminopeptidase N